jgi:hypothetical protein
VRHEFDSLRDKPKSGRRSIIPEGKHAEIIDIVKEDPKQIKSAIPKIEEKFGKKISVKTLRKKMIKIPSIYTILMNPASPVCLKSHTLGKILMILCYFQAEKLRELMCWDS